MREEPIRPDLTGSTVGEGTDNRGRRPPPTLDGRDSSFVVESRSLRLLAERADRFAVTDISVLLEGETGCGKNVLAEIIHKKSGRSGELVIVNCAAITESLAENELFGHRKGSYTGAIEQCPGCFEQADKGTLLLNEVDKAPRWLQAKILDVLEMKSVKRLGDRHRTSVDFRTLAAANADLTDLVNQGGFLRDLYYRIAVCTLRIPPLRDRVDDILPLARLFFEKYSQKYRQSKPSISVGAAALLLAYTWPGNVRELDNMMACAAVDNSENELSAELVSNLLRQPLLSLLDQPSRLEEAKKAQIEFAIRNTDSDRTAAQSLGIKLSTLNGLKSQYGIYRHKVRGGK